MLEIKNHSSDIIYILGIIGWCVLWGLLYNFNNSYNLNLFGSTKNWHWFLFPIILGFFTLIINAYLSRNHNYATYEIEVKIIEIVERNASWFLVGSSAIFTWASLAKTALDLSFAITPFVIYVALSIIFLCFVILLYWTPYQSNGNNENSESAKNLGRLRHCKTVPFTYAVSFFSAALLIILTSVLPS